MSKYKELFKKRMEQDEDKTSRYQATSTTLGASATAIRDKFVIEQKIRNNLAQGKRAPYCIQRSIDDKIPEVPRKLGEGSKPLFDRSDVKVNPSIRSPISKKKYRRYSSSSSSSSSSPPYNNPKYKERWTPPRKNKKSPAPQKEEKVPYFMDSRREEERLRRLEQNYKELRKSRFPTRRRSRSRSKSVERKRRHHSRSYSPTLRRKYDTSSHRNRSRSKSPQSHSRVEPQIPPVIHHVPYPVPIHADPFAFRMQLAPSMVPYPIFPGPHFHGPPRFNSQIPSQYYPGNYRPRYYPPRGSRYGNNRRY